MMTNKYTICGAGAVVLHSGFDQTLSGWLSVLFVCWLALVVFTDDEVENVG